jgi:hypothetical protein
MTKDEIFALGIQARLCDGRKAGGGGMKEEWLFSNAVVPVDVETTAALVAEIKRLIDVVGGMALAQPTPAEYAMGYAEGFNDACKPNYTASPQRTWVGLTDDEIKEIVGPYGDTPIKGYTRRLFDQIEAKLREKNT